MRSMSSPMALSMMTAGPGPAARRRQIDNPSSPGIITSRITNSTSLPTSTASIEDASWAVETV